MAISQDDEPIIRADGLIRRVAGPEGPLTLLDGVDLSVARGDSLAIVGPSGSGKSTLLGLLAGLDLPTSGRVWLDGHELTALDEERRAAVRAAGVGFVFQSFQLLPGLTAVENIRLPLALIGRRDAEARALEMLKRVGLAHRLHHPVIRLSGGEQQRVAIARAFAAEPAVLFADEPTGNLDQATGAHIAELLFELNAERATTLVIVTHDQRLAAKCRQRTGLVEGRLAEAPA